MELNTHQNKKSNKANKTSQPFFSGKDGNEGSFFSPKGAQPQSQGFFGASPVAQKKSNGESEDQEQGDALSLEDARKAIFKATRGIGTDEEGIYKAIRNCSSRRSLMTDTEVLNALKGDMDGHDLWKAYLLMEYANEASFPSAIKQVWKATKGAGTDEDAVFAAIQKMDKRAKTSFGLKGILKAEMSGKDLQKALDLLVTSDSIKGNIYGGKKGEKEDLVVTEDNLRQLIGSQFTGAASEDLKGAMMILYSKPGGEVLKEALARIESIRGLATGSALAQYNKAMALQIAGIDHYKAKKEAAGHRYNHATDNPSPALDTGKHESFTASNAQLRFGKLVGDVFGIDAVFGSLMSPTGGMAGGGNERVPLIGDESAVATHGAIHDAGGYLYNCHGVGPGYDYFKSEAGSKPGHHLAGQTNMNWFMKEFKKKGKDVGKFERFLASKAHIGAAFSKDYTKLNLTQKKETLKIMSETYTATLMLGGLDNTMRVNGVRDLMSSCSSGDKTKLADYFYENNGFTTIGKVFNVMKPHVSPSVYQEYIRRMAAQSAAYY